MELLSTNLQSQKISQCLISKINKPYHPLSIKEKIDLSAEIIQNRPYVISQDAFLQEECHVTLLNWIWKIRNKINSENFEFLHLNDLLFNIILIFETFPIQTDTLVSCHFLTKLNLITNQVNEINSALACRIRTLVHYWDEQIKKIKLNKLLQKKRSRSKEESNAESENDSEDTQCSKPSKKVHWKDTLVEIVCINTNDKPCN